MQIYTLFWKWREVVIFFMIIRIIHPKKLYKKVLDFPVQGIITRRKPRPLLLGELPVTVRQVTLHKSTSPNQLPPR